MITKVLALFIVFLLSVNCSVAQAESDSLFIGREAGGYYFYNSTGTLTLNQVVSAMKPNEKAHKQIISARLNKGFANIFGGIGGFLFGYQIGTVIGGGEPDLRMGGFGIGLVVVSFNCSKRFYKKARQAIDTFNAALEVNPS